MMKLLRKSGILLILGCLIFGCAMPTTVVAQDVFTHQASKLQGQIIETVNKGKENVQRVVSNISESQFGKAIGKGFAVAKKAMNTAKSYYNKAMSAYQNAAAELKASKAYQALQLSKKLASEEKTLKALNQEREEAIQALEDETDAEIETLKAKQLEENENKETAREIYQQQLEEAATEATRAILQEKIDALDNDSGTSEYDADVKKAESRLKRNKLSVQAKYAKKIAKQAKVIAAIGVEIANLYSKKEIKDPDTLISEAKDKFNFGAEIKTLDEREEKTSDAKEQTKTDLLTAMNNSENVVSPDGDEGDAKRTADGITTTAGKSDAAVQMAQALAVQLTSLKNDILTDALYLQVETATILTQEKASVIDGLTAIDICNYTSEGKTESKNILQQLNDIKETVTDTAQNTANNTLYSLADTTAQAVDTSGITGAVNDGIEDLTAAVTGIEDMETSITKDVTGIQGML